jgi:hypothetical protein
MTGRFVDPGKLLPLCVSLQKFYESIGAKTQVLPASLTSTDEIYALAGVHHITISPGLLQQLSQPGFTSQTKSLFDADFPKPEAQTSYANRESVYRLEFSRAERGASEEKLTQVCLWKNFLLTTGYLRC